MLAMQVEKVTSEKLMVSKRAKRDWRESSEFTCPLKRADCVLLKSASLFPAVVAVS